MTQGRLISALLLFLCLPSTVKSATVNCFVQGMEYQEGETNPNPVGDRQLTLIFKCPSKTDDESCQVFLSDAPMFGEKFVELEVLKNQRFLKRFRYKLNTFELDPLRGQLFYTYNLGRTGLEMGQGKCVDAP